MLSCRITQLRRSIGMSQLQLAQKLYLSPSTIGMYEQGRRMPSIDVLVQMSRIFHVSLDYLITGKDSVPSSENRGVNTTTKLCPCQNCCCQKMLDIIRENMSLNRNRHT